MAEEPGACAQRAAGTVGGPAPAPSEPANRTGLAFEAEFSGTVPAAAGGGGMFFEALVFLGHAQPS